MLSVLSVKNANKEATALASGWRQVERKGQDW